MPRPKRQPDTGRTSGSPPPPRNSASTSRKYALYWVGAAFLLGALVLFWQSPFFQNLSAGPKVPLPRQVGELALGMPQTQILEKMPEVEDLLRDFNEDPLFRIATVPNPSLVPGASSLDLIFFGERLYFISAMWEGEKAASVPVTQWAESFRRWNPQRDAASDAQSLGEQVLLKEWNFSDGATEMIVRDLSYPAHLQRWQDIRDASNGPAQAAFAKYRLDAGS